MQTADLDELLTDRIVCYICVDDFNAQRTDSTYMRQWIWSLLV